MDEKVEKEDVTNLKDAITDEVEFELDTDELGIGWVRFLGQFPV